LPENLGIDHKDEHSDFGELLAMEGPWPWDKPVAIYPLQISDRVRAQRGWFTIHGNDPDPLEVQAPGDLFKLILGPECVEEALKFLELFGLNRFSMYTDLDSLALWIRQESLPLAKTPPAQRTRPVQKRRRDQKHHQA